MKRLRPVICSLGAIAGALLWLASPGVAARPHRPGATVLSVGAPAAVQPIAPGFLGLSLEYWAVPLYAGSDYAASYAPAINPVFVQLVRNLAGGQAPVLRIGGDTTDSTWWPVPGATTPPGVSYALSPTWVQITRDLASELRAKLILGINFEADSATVASTEAKALVDGIGRGRVEALELGNEPELYKSFIWGGSGATGRPRSYDFAAFDRDFAAIARSVPGIPLAGPAVGAPHWFGHVGQFLSDQRRVVVATLHRYPLQYCWIPARSPEFPTIGHLFSAWSTRNLAGTVAGVVKAAHARHVPVRIDEINTVSCGDVPAVSSSFASALWGVDILFQMASVGVDGVNMHTFPGAAYQLFTFSRSGGQWQASVAPEYYGLELFSQAAPSGSRLLTVTPAGSRRLKAWATRSRDRTTRVVVLNEGAGTRTVAVHVPGTSPGAGARAGRSRAPGATGTLVRLQAPGLLATDGITLGGEGFGAATETGRPAGRADRAEIRPHAGAYRFTVPAYSAALLTLPSR